MDKFEIRREMRKKRASLTPKQQLEAARGLLRQSRQFGPLRKAKRILSYEPFGGEIDPSLFVHTLAHHRLFLPRITNFRNCAMHFYSGDKTEQTNKYGIREPRAIGTPLHANQLDLILVPLVAFDRNGTRIGMGAGYYDRALESLNYQTSTKPFLLGVAHHFQEQKSLRASPWDVPLDGILTDLEFIQI